MCGIAGFVRPGGTDDAVLRAMCDAIGHRGPDERGAEIVLDTAALGFDRLAIIDLVGGNQPLHDERRRISATCNGEVYNFRELRRELEQRGHSFATGSDAEVIPHLYEERDVECLHALQGMFAIALWDSDRRRLLLARDRMGVKPLYWAELPGGGVAWGSEPTALFAGGLVDARPDPAALMQSLSLMYVPSPGSGFAGVRKLAPGERLIWEDGRVTVDRWWSLPDPAQTAAISTDDAVEHLDELLAEATRARLIADVPLGAFLSGGIDSSLVVGYMAEAAGTVKTFSIDFPYAQYSEVEHARKVARLYGTDHSELVLEADMIPTLVGLVGNLGEPLADPSVVPTYVLSHLTRREVTVALSGDGGDEAFGGYWRYRRAERAELLARVGGPLTGAAARAMSDSRRPRIASAGDLLALAAQPRDHIYPTLMSHFTPAQLSDLCTPEFVASAGGVDAAWKQTLALPAAEGVNRYTALDARTYLPDALLTKVDRASMAHALEVRSPLLDYRVQSWAAGVPAKLKLRRGTTKWILRELARRRGLPEDIVDRPKKGFGMPIGAWLAGELRAWMCDLLTDDRARGRGYFRTAQVERIIAAHVDGREQHASRLWNLIMLELWHRRFIDSAS